MLPEPLRALEAERGALQKAVREGSAAHADLAARLQALEEFVLNQPYKMTSIIKFRHQPDNKPRSWKVWKP